MYKKENLTLTHLIYGRIIYTKDDTDISLGSTHALQHTQSTFKHNHYVEDVVSFSSVSLPFSPCRNEKAAWNVAICEVPAKEKKEGETEGTRKGVWDKEEKRGRGGQQAKHIRLFN